MKITRLSRPAYTVLCFVMALYMLLTLRMDVSPAEANHTLGLVDTIRMALTQMTPLVSVQFAALLGVVWFAGVTPIAGIWHGACTVVTALFLTGCMMVGKAFIASDWGNLAIRINFLTISKWLFCLPGWFTLCFCALLALYRLLDAIGARQSPLSARSKHKVLRVFDDHPFAAPFVLLVICFLPVTVLSFPGIVVATDTMAQIAQPYGKRWGGYPVIFEDSAWNNHHPVFHTMLIHLFLEFGKAFLGAAQHGLSLFVCTQMLLTAAALAFALSQLRNLGMSAGIRLVLSLFIGLHPRVQNYIVVISKDMLYADCLLLMGIGLIWTCRSSKQTKSVALLLFSAVLILLLRNEGVYIVLATMAMLFLLFRPCRRIAASGFILCLSLWTIWTNAIFPALHISPGSTREMLSIPFQQTARYVRSFSDEVTDQERAAIDAVLPYDKLAEYYKPSIADSIKDMYRESATREDKAIYFKTWASMFLKHPMTYIEAFLDNKNLWLYPSVASKVPTSTYYSYFQNQFDYQVINENCSEFGISLTNHNMSNGLCSLYEQIRERIFALPILNLLTQSAPIMWSGAILMGYALYKKRKLSILLLTPVLLIELIILVGPCDGTSFRYVYPILLYLILPFGCALYEKN